MTRPLKAYAFCSNNKGVEIGMLPVSPSGESGWQFCNLNEINGGKCTSKEVFYNACRAAAILGTFQAGYTDFKYISKATKDITEREALIGVSITGWMNNPDILFDKETMKKGAEIVKQTNKQVAKLLGINQAARTTCVKPSGTASVSLGTASGIHGEHSPLYIRNVQMNEQDEVLALIKQTNPEMVEKSVWSTNGTDFVVGFPVASKQGSIYKHDLLGVKQLEYVKLAQQNWIEYGTNVELCTDPRLRHNVSNTITVDDWDEVEQYLFDNRQWFAGVSLLSASGDKAYAQAPFTEVFTAKQILETYGEGSMLASGLIVDALHAFDNNLWMACSTMLGTGLALTEDSKDLLKRDWVRRANKFAERYFQGNKEKSTFCLKDCHNLHKWLSINKTIKPIDFSSVLSKQKYTDVDTIGAIACNGGQCEVVF
jgi:ribonucleoside-triphosphate reductase (thioredoxin)